MKLRYLIRYPDGDFLSKADTEDPMEYWKSIPEKGGKPMVLDDKTLPKVMLNRHLCNSDAVIIQCSRYDTAKGYTDKMAKELKVRIESDIYFSQVIAPNYAPPFKDKVFIK